MMMVGGSAVADAQEMSNGHLQWSESTSPVRLLLNGETSTSRLPLRMEQPAKPKHL